MFLIRFILIQLNGCKIDDCDPTMLEVDGFRVTSCVFSPNDKLLAVSGDRKVTVMDTIDCIILFLFLWNPKLFFWL